MTFAIEVVEEEFKKSDKCYYIYIYKKWMLITTNVFRLYKTIIYY